MGDAGSEQWLVVQRKYDNDLITDEFETVAVLPTGSTFYTDDEVLLTGGVLPGTYT